MNPLIPIQELNREYKRILSQKVCLKGSKKGPTLAWQP